MTIFFASARSAESSAIVRALTASVPLGAANDNTGDDSGEHLLRPTLRHFAQHGLNAPRKACEKAEAAMRAGDFALCCHWLAICRQLDRRLAEAETQRLILPS